MKTDNPGYHVNVIDKGVYGQFSKVAEEFQEVQDAWEQDCSIMALVELSDMLGAMETFYPDFHRHAAQAEEQLRHRMVQNKHQPAEARSRIEITESFQFVKNNHNPEWAVSNLLSQIMEYLVCFNMSFDDAMKMSTITKRAFINGRRIIN
jgi:arginyl-tRNA synthetase